MNAKSSRTTARRSPPSLVDAVARCAIRRALRPFLRRFDIAYVAILSVPSGTAGYYRRATAGVILDPSPVDSTGNRTAEILFLTDQASSIRSINDHFLHNRQIVIIAEDMEQVTPELRAAADIVTTIATPTAEHFMAAARIAEMPGMTVEFAKFLTTVPFDILATAIRRARPLSSSVREIRKLSRMSVASTAAVADSIGPRLEEMAGYGAAQTWGLQLAVDLRAWRNGEIGWDDIDRGVLLYGPPGCGKTSYAEALANSCGVKLIIASAARWQAAGHLGDYLKAMRSAFAEAAKNAPCILFVDEADSFGDREGGGDSDHRDYKRQVINALLECLDPVEGREGVVVVGATNNPDAIDRALLRSGRLETQIEITLPDANARVAILHHHLRDNAIHGDLARFVSATAGWSGADIEKLARDARRLARRRGTSLDQRILLEAMPERYVLSASELHRTAVHEIGHAIVGVVLGSDVLLSVVISRDAPVSGPAVSVGRNVIAPDKGRIRNVAYFDDRIAMLLGGIAAELVVFGDRADGAGGAPASDLMQASDIATRIERQLGLGENLSVDLGKGERPLEYLRASDPELRRLVDARLKVQFDRAVGLLSGYRAQLDRLTELLLFAGVVTGEQVREQVCEATKNTASVRT
ncbi:UNVERIFIED_ORG: ATP-dependent Zn protease [Rhizobium etli]